MCAHITPTMTFARVPFCISQKSLQGVGTVHPPAPGPLVSPTPQTAGVGGEKPPDREQGQGEEVEVSSLRGLSCSMETSQKPQKCTP